MVSTLKKKLYKRRIFSQLEETAEVFKVGSAGMNIENTSVVDSGMRLVFLTMQIIGRPKLGVT